MEARKLKKVLLLGNANAGKTALLNRHVNNRFNSTYHSTIGVSFENKDYFVSDNMETIQLWDTSGQENFQGVMYRSFYDGMKAILIVFDMTKPNWKNDIRNQLTTHIPAIPKDAAIFIVGTKKDLIKDPNELQQKEIALQNFVSNQDTLEEIYPELANRKIYCATTSANTGEDVQRLFDTVVETVVDKNDRVDPGQQNEKRASLDAITALAGRIDYISGEEAFWRNKVGSYAQNKGETSPDGVKQIYAEKNIENLESRLTKICKDANYKRSSFSITEWFHSFFRSRHPATEEFYGILSKLDNFSEKTVVDVTRDLEQFWEKYSPAKKDKIDEVQKLIKEILEEGARDKKFLHASAQEILKNINNVEMILSIAEKNHSSFPGFHFFSDQIPDPKLNELYEILRELKELDNDSVDSATVKLQQFKKDNTIEPVKSNIELK